MVDPAPTADDGTGTPEPREHHDEAQDSAESSRQYRLGQQATYGNPERRGASRAQADATRSAAAAYEAQAAAFSELIRALVSELEGEKQMMPPKYSDRGLDNLIQRIGGIVDDLTIHLEHPRAVHYAFVHRTVEGPGQIEHVVELAISYGKLLDGYDAGSYSRFEARARLQRLIAALGGLDPYGNDPYTTV